MATVVHWGKYYPPHRGGIESVTASVAKGAAAAGHEVTVVCFAKQSEGSAANVDGVRVLRVPEAAFVASQPLGWSYLSSALREGRRADLVHVHVPNMLAAFAVILLGRKPKLIVHWHSDVIAKGALGILLRPLERIMLRRADLIVCTSQAYAEASLLLRPVLHKVRAVPIGVPDVRSDSASVLPVELANQIRGRRFVLAVGRLVPYKGFHNLVEAATQLPRDAMVVIVGSGPREAELQSQIKCLGLQDRVLLTGELEKSALDALFRKAILFCLPSVERSEAFGVALAEAMTYGMPVVATQIAGSGVPWVNQHQITGLNVQADSPAALAAACNEILGSDALRARLGSGARQRYMEEFTEQVSIARMLEIYRLAVCGASYTGQANPRRSQ